MQAVHRFLAVGTFWKILLANALVVTGALAIAPEATHALRPDASSLAVLGVVTALTLLVNAAVLWLALRPLTELERAAERVAEGDLRARALVSPLADRPLAGLTRTFNRMVESVEAQREEVRAFASRTVSDAEEANSRLSRDLREDTSQTLATAMIRLRAIRGSDSTVARDAVIDEVRESLAQVIEQLRSFAGQLRPSTLDLLGVDQVIEAYATTAALDAGIRVDVERDSLRGLLSPGPELAMLHVVEEAVDQALARAQAAVHIRLGRGDGRAVATILDDGALSVPPTENGRGLFAMRERASYFGGTVSVTDAGLGTVVTVEFPLTRVS